MNSNNASALISEEFPQASSSRHPSPTTISVPVQDLINGSSLSPLSDRKGKGKERMVNIDLDLEPDFKRTEGGHEEDSYNSISEDERNSTVGSDTEGEDEENYEAERQRRIRENQVILAGLGIEPSASFQAGSGSGSGLINATGGSSTSKTRNRNSSPTPGRKRKNGSDIPILDRSGHIISLPPEGKTHTMACIEMPSDRKLKKRISDGEYIDCSKWSQGEWRRWKYGFGKGGDIPPDEDEFIGGVGKDFRWRRWRGLEKELRSEMRRRGELVEMDARPTQQVITVPEGVSAYSLLPGEPCHQCRRKSDKPKMKCRNVNPICRATFCETCCKRYSYFDFDEESRSFICPLCKDICNCSNCIRKKNLAHLLGDSKGKIKRQSIKYSMGAEAEGEMTVQAWLEKAVKDVSRAPFDLIRIVDQDKDVISPDLPPEEEEDIGDKIIVHKPRKMRAKKMKLGDKVEKETVEKLGEEKPKAKRGRKKRILDENGGSKVDQFDGNKGTMKSNNLGNLIIKLKIPKLSEKRLDVIPPERERLKEVDSDGDTVGDWSSHNGEGEQVDDSSSALSSLPSDSPPIPARFPFPPRSVFSQIPDTNEYLSTLPSTLQDQTQSQPVLVESTNDIPPLPSQPMQFTPPPPLLVDANTIRSSPDISGDEHAHPKKRKRPPPKANIVRAPRHSSFSTKSDPPTIVNANGNPNRTHPAAESKHLAIPTNDNQKSERDSEHTIQMQGPIDPPVPRFSIPLENSDSRMEMGMDNRLGIGPPALPNFIPPPLLSIQHTQPHQYLNGLEQNRPFSYWAPRATLMRGEMDTLYNSSIHQDQRPEYQRQQFQYQNHQQIASNATPSSSYPTIPLPADYSSYSYNPTLPSMTMHSDATTFAPRYSESPNVGIMGGNNGPPPYSHSPIRRPLVLSPNTERQYLVIDRSPHFHPAPIPHSDQPFDRTTSIVDRPSRPTADLTSNFNMNANPNSSSVINGKSESTVQDTERTKWNGKSLSKTKSKPNSKSKTDGFDTFDLLSLAAVEARQNPNLGYNLDANNNVNDV
ncbi:uncharacterized protein IL334_000583 [Kwoniella shivajii]|uniref:RING-type domain-containing protein n=1 Tax=Kwoniella shivajii TaxID=564305 RepID=A0ABZ1CPW2_9TREE|nr:hypothetical protein IL334_000583 [Kwoniella shivajii]